MTFIHKSLTLSTHIHTRLTALCPGLPRWAGTRKVKPTWILLKQETVSGSSISWAICKFAPHSRQITTPARHHSVFYRPDALPAAQPTASKHWRQIHNSHYLIELIFADLFVVVLSNRSICVPVCISAWAISTESNDLSPKPSARWLVICDHF